ncbi:MAG: hypothetical protein ABF868_08660 [Sporolactobacillus sp.]
MTAWQCQDILKLSVEQWTAALKNPHIFNEQALNMVYFVYRQKDAQSTATAIAAYFSEDGPTIYQQTITACNRHVAKALYKRYHVEPPVGDDGYRRYWNVVFDGNPEQPKDASGHFYWRLRPHLNLALSAMTAGASSLPKQ